jgi:ElaB/YqjD/DUF883 family membrane-anchored ribosome-binding protein
MEMYLDNMTAEEGTKEKLVQDLMTLVHDAEELVKATGTNVADKSKTELIDALKRVKASCQRVEASASASVRRADHFVRQHPYEVAGGAFALGLLLGVLVTRD